MLFHKKSFYLKTKKYIVLPHNYHILYFGNCSFCAKQALYLNAKFLMKFILFIKKITRKVEKSLRRFWLIPQSLLAITLKSKGARMGKGKGKKLIYFQRIFARTNFIEFLGVRLGRLYYFLFYWNNRFYQKFYLYRSLLNNNQTGVVLIK